MYVTISVPKSATSDTRKLTMPHWPRLRVRSGRIGGGLGNGCTVEGPEVVVGAVLTWRLRSIVLPVRVIGVFQVPQRPAAMHGRDHGKVIRGRGRRRGPLESPGIPG